MKIGIIGAGFVGRAISKLALAAGHQVMLSNSRDPKTLFTLTRTTQCEAGTPQQAAEFGDVVVIAIPLEAYRSVPAAPLVGKVVIDANNYYPDRDGRIPELDQHQTTTSEMLAEHLQLALDGAQVTLQARVLELLVQLPGGDLAPTRDAAQQLNGQQGGFQGVGALGHCGRSNG